MSLKNLHIQDQYRSDRHHLIRDFYIPCLENSVIYRRAVGFFSSSSMAVVAKGLAAFIHSGGRMQLIASPHLSEADADAIAQGLKDRQDVITASIVNELEQEFHQIVQHRLECLAWLLKHELLEIKLAVPTRNRHRGIYHEKLGIFVDADGNQIVFTGSANESSAALIDNFECLDILWSWEPVLASRITVKVANFQKLWMNETPNLEVIEFPEAAKRSLLRLCPKEPPTDDLELVNGQFSSHEEMAGYGGDLLDLSEPPSQSGTPMMPDWLTLRPYQEEAIANWFTNKGRGTLKMATGSGKTITALAIAAQLYEKIQLQALIVICPYRHLVQQWDRECRKFGLTPILAYNSVTQWQNRLSNQLINLRLELQPFVTVITTNATFGKSSFQSQLGSFPKKTLLIGDETHNLGAERLVSSLPKTVGLRLGLSATPERYFDDRGTQALFDYFGTVLEPEFTLGDAIEQGALVHYRYYPILVELTEAEVLEYGDLSAKIGRAIAISSENSDNNESLTLLLSKRARLIGAAKNKIHALRELMQQRLETDHTLFYCGDGSVEDSVTQESIRQLEAVTQLLGTELGYRVNTYTAETSLDEREDLRRQFETGELQGLVAIRCLDEGVDIPAIQTAVILASSSNPRQFVQRRGRILRRHQNKQRADLFDMIVVPPDVGRESLQTEKTLLAKELQRFAEFANLADNAGEARAKLLPLQDRYGLMDIYRADE